MFSGCTVPPVSKESELGSSDQGDSTSAGKYTGIVSVPCLPMEVLVDIPEVPGCQFLRQMSSQWGSQQLLQGLVSHELTAYFYLFNLFKLNESWPHYQKHVNKIILNHIHSKAYLYEYSRPSFEFC